MELKLKVEVVGNPWKKTTYGVSVSQATAVLEAASNALSDFPAVQLWGKLVQPLFVYEDPSIKIEGRLEMLPVGAAPLPPGMQPEGAEVVVGFYTVTIKCRSVKSETFLINVLEPDAVALGHLQVWIDGWPAPDDTMYTYEELIRFVELDEL